MVAPSKKNSKPKTYKYLVFWWASHSGASFSNGTVTIILTGTLFTEKMFPEVLAYVRKETGQQNANIMSFSRYGG